MHKALIKHYFRHIFVELTKLALYFASAILVSLVFYPWKSAFKMSSFLLSLSLSLKTLQGLKKLTFKSFLWKMEKNNPHLNEALISYYELRKNPSPYVDFLRGKIELLLRKKLEYKAVFGKEIRLLFYSLILFLLSLALFPSTYSGLSKFKVGEISPRYVLTCTDSANTFRAEKVVKFYIETWGKKELKPLGKDSVLVVSFPDTGKFLIHGKFKGKELFPSLVKVIRKPVIDSFLIVTPHRTYKNVNWVGVKEGTKVQLRIYAPQECSLNLWQENKLVASSRGSTSFSFSAVKEFSFYVDVSQRGITKRYTLSTISPIPNLPPRIEIEDPKDLFSYVPQSMILKIKGKVTDEDKVKAIYLHYSTRWFFKREKWVPPPREEVDFNFALDLQKLGMLPGDELKFYVLAEDLEGLIDSSQIYTVIFPTLENIYKEEATKIMEVSQAFQEGTKSFEEIKGKIQSISDSLKLNQTNENVSENIEKLTEGLKTLKENLENLLQTLELTQKISISPELLQKMETLGNELWKLINEEFPEIAKKIEEAKKLNFPQNVKKWEEIQKSSDEMMEKLSYLEKLLEFAKKEMLFKELEEKVQTFKEKREALINYAKEGDIKKIAETEKTLLDTLNSLEREVNQVAKEIGLENEVGNYLERIKELQQKIVESASKGRKRETVNLQEKQLSELKEFLKSISNAKKTNLDQDISRLLAIIGEIRRVLIATSLSLEDNLGEGKFFPYVMGTLKEVKKSLYEAGMLVIMFAPRLPKLINMAMDSLYLNPKVSLELINQAIFELFRLQAQATSQKQGGSGMDAMKFLENMMKQQAEMIRQTGAQMELPIPLPQFQSSILEKTAEMKSQLLSLYMQARNNEVREHIEKALQEFSKMEDKIRKGEIDKELQELQRKTLKHMLDAYGEYKKEEYTEKRYAEPAKPYKFEVPKSKIPIDLKKLNMSIEKLSTLPEEEQKLLREFYNRILLNY